MILHQEWAAQTPQMATALTMNALVENAAAL